MPAPVRAFFQIPQISTGRWRACSQTRVLANAFSERCCGRQTGFGMRTCAGPSGGSGSVWTEQTGTTGRAHRANIHLVVACTTSPLRTHGHAHPSTVHVRALGRYCARTVLSCDCSHARHHTRLQSTKTDSGVCEIKYHAATRRAHPGSPPLPHNQCWRTCRGVALRADGTLFRAACRCVVPPVPTLTAWGEGCLALGSPWEVVLYFANTGIRCSSSCPEHCFSG